MNINDKYIVEIIDEDNIGNGIAKINNKVIFIKNALKEEKVEIEIIKTNKNYSTAKIIRILNKSKNRVEPICKYYNECGGCSFLHTTIENENNNKIRYLERLFNRKIDFIKTNNYTNYRKVF